MTISSHFFSSALQVNRFSAIPVDPILIANQDVLTSFNNIKTISLKTEKFHRLSTIFGHRAEIGDVLKYMDTNKKVLMQKYAAHI